MSETLGRYQLDRRLAAGGMAEVFLARQSGPEGFEKLCVVKRMLPHLSEDQVFVGMFLDEARLAAKLNHPNIAQIFDFGRHEDTYYLALEHVPGVNLQVCIDHCQRLGRRIPMPTALRVASLVAQALDYAHRLTDENGQSLNLIHRDISPHNVMISESGDVKLIDFGIAKASSATSNTKAGTLKGKYAYMSPEHIRGQAIDKRIDIYSLGLVLYEMLAGQPAIFGDSEAALMRAAAKREIIPIENLRAEVPREVRQALERALALLPADRFATAGELSDALEDHLTSQGLRVKPAHIAELVPNNLQAPYTGKFPVQLATPSFGPETDVDVEASTRLSASDATLTAASQSTLMDEEVPAAGEATTAEVARPVPSPMPARPPPEVKTAPGEPPNLRSTRPPLWPAIAGAFALGVGAFGVYEWRGRTAVEQPLLVPPPPVAEVAPKVEVPKVEAPKVEAVPPAPAVEAKPEPAPVPAPAPAPPPTGKKPPKGKKVAQAETKAPAAKKGTVVFRVIPWGEVFLGGKSLGVTPMQPLSIEAGVHAFKVTNPETKKTKEVSVTVKGGEEALLKVDLR